MRADKLNTNVRQDQLAKAALHLVLQRGWKSVSVAAVAKKVGVVPSNIYRHFRGKDALMEAVLGLVRERLLRNVAEAKAQSSQVFEQLHALVWRHVRLIRGELPIPRVVFSEEVFSGHSRRRKLARQVFQDYLDAVSGILAKGQEEQSIRSDLRPETLAVLFLGLVQPAAILWLMSGGDFDLEQHCETAWQLFAESIRARHTPKL